MRPLTKQPYQQTSIYLTAEDRHLVEELQQQTGLGLSALIRLALQRMYHGEEKSRQTRLLAIAEEIRKLA